MQQCSTNQMYVLWGRFLSDEAFSFRGIAWTWKKWYSKIQGRNTLSNTFKDCGFAPVIKKTQARNFTLSTEIWYPCELQLLHWKSDGLSFYLQSNL